MKIHIEITEDESLTRQDIQDMKTRARQLGKSPSAWAAETLRKELAKPLPKKPEEAAKQAA